MASRQNKLRGRGPYLTKEQEAETRLATRMCTTNTVRSVLAGDGRTPTGSMNVPCGNKLGLSPGSGRGTLLLCIKHGAVAWDASEVMGTR